MWVYLYVHAAGFFASRGPRPVQPSPRCSIPFSKSRPNVPRSLVVTTPRQNGQAGPRVRAEGSTDSFLFLLPQRCMSFYCLFFYGYQTSPTFIYLFFKVASVQFRYVDVPVRLLMFRSGHSHILTADEVKHLQFKDVL